MRCSPSTSRALRRHDGIHPPESRRRRSSEGRPCVARSSDPCTLRGILALALLAFAGSLAALAGPGSATARESGSSCGAGANGSEGYAYAGHQANAVAHGVQATITPTSAASVSAGHVAGWIGVGGPGAGAQGEALWLQVGVVSLPNTPTTLYAEIMRGGAAPEFVPLLRGIEVGESHRVAVLEMATRPNWWRVWLDGKAVTEPVLLESSTRRWKPIATAESWDGGKQTCNSFAFRFEGVVVAGARGGSWRAFAPGYKFEDRGFRVRRLSQPRGGIRMLADTAPRPYAFEAQSLSST